MTETILLTGATGYVGGRLLKQLEQDGFDVHCLARAPEKLPNTGPHTKVFQGDILDRVSMWAAFQGVTTAYYLVHSLADKHDFEAHEIEAADNFAIMARSAGVKRIIYLGGLGNDRDGLSPHLQSRHDVGLALRRSGIQTIELRASIVLGAGSLSFEMIRALTEHLPFMVMPKWVSVKAQPIGVQDLLKYLIASIDLPLEESRVIEIGGSDQVSYRDLMVEYARQRGLKRLMIPIPLLTPWLSSHWLGLVTPLYATVGRKLIASIRNPTVIENSEEENPFRFETCSMREAIAQALSEERQDFLRPDWLDGIAVRHNRPRHQVIHDKNRIVDYRCSLVTESPRTLYRVVSSLGGKDGMFSFNGLWRVRELIDRLAGGKLQRNQRNKETPIREGDAIDFFHAEIVEEDQRIRLRTGLKLPGEAWLEFKLVPSAAGTQFHHAVIYEPKGFSGQVYWYVTYPLHALIFRSMHKAMLREAERIESFDSAVLIPLAH